VTADPFAWSPFASRDAGLGRIGVAALRFLTQVDVRCTDAAAGRLGFPLVPNTVVGDLQRGVLWLGPDEWLVVGLPGTVGVTVAELEASLEGEHRSVLDVSANRVVLEMTNVDRREVLASACSIDLDPRSWRSMMCAQTLLGRAPVILQELPASTRIFVRPSFAGYVADLLLAAAV
jgi:sarcosine oxidase, subunit gamma